MITERLGILDGQLVTITESSSGYDENLFVVEGQVWAKLGPAEDSEIVVLDPERLSFKSLKDAGNGNYSVEITPKGSEEGSRVIYISKGE